MYLFVHAGGVSRILVREQGFQPPARRLNPSTRLPFPLPPPPLPSSCPVTTRPVHAISLVILTCKVLPCFYMNRIIEALLPPHTLASSI